MITYPDKCVDSHDCHIWLTLGIVHQIQVHQFFQLQVVSLDTIHNIGKQSTEKL